MDSLRDLETNAYLMVDSWAPSCILAVILV